MEYTHILVCLGLIYVGTCDGAGLLHGESQEQVPFATSPAPGGPSPTPQIGGILRGLVDAPGADQYTARDRAFYPTRGNIRKSFSLETTTSPTTPHFEALTGRNGSSRPQVRALNLGDQGLDDQQEQILDRFNSLRRGQSQSSPSYDSRSYEERVLGSTTEGHIQRVPLRQWSTGPNVIREEDLDGSLGSFAYATPATSTQQPLSFRGNVRYSTPTDGPEYDLPREGKNLPQDDRRRTYIVPTTYRPLFKPNTTPNEYSFTFRTQNHSRHEFGNSKGQFRGSIKFLDTQGRDKEINYEASPERGLVTSEVPHVSIAGMSGHRDIPPPPVTTPSPYSPGPGAYSYSYATNDPVPSSTVAYDNDLRYGQNYPTTEYYQNPYPTQQTMRSLPTPDGSYVFSYDAGDHDRQEVRDSDGSVRGAYSYQSPDGERKTVRYEANARSGFVAQGRHLPVQEARSPPSQYSGAEEEPSDGTYFFSYDAGDHARQEVRDSNGNVQGSFSFLTGDGFRKTVHYHANPQDGFHIKSTHVTQSQQYQ